MKTPPTSANSERERRKYSLSTLGTPRFLEMGFVPLVNQVLAEPLLDQPKLNKPVSGQHLLNSSSGVRKLSVFDSLLLRCLSMRFSVLRSYSIEPEVIRDLGLYNWTCQEIRIGSNPPRLFINFLGGDEICKSETRQRSRVGKFSTKKISSSLDLFSCQAERIRCRGQTDQPIAP